MNITPGDLVYYISDEDGSGEIGMYIGRHGISNYAPHSIQWSLFVALPDNVTNETEATLHVYRQQYLDFRKKNG